MPDDFDISALDKLGGSERARVEGELKKTLDRELEVINRPIRPTPSRRNFQAVLTRLSTDKDYREQAATDPSLITMDYKLSLKELQALRQVAILSGADTKVVDRLRADTIVNAGPAGLDSVDVSCCSCCCCCCGDTAVTVTG